jgi:RNA polymerase sigma-70 factor, ECF subfamily
MHDSERERIFAEWLAGHKGSLFKVVYAYAFRGESSVLTCAYRVALNTAIAWTRKEGRHRRSKEPFEGMEDLLTTEPSQGRDPRVEWLYRQIALLAECQAASCSQPRTAFNR